MLSRLKTDLIVVNVTKYQAAGLFTAAVQSVCSRNFDTMPLGVSFEARPVLSGWVQSFVPTKHKHTDLGSVLP